MQHIITIEDIKNIRQIASNVDDVNSINPYITEAQNIDFRRLLGIKFFNILRKEFETVPVPDRSNDLLEGCKYMVDNVEIEFLGIKPLISYYAYARALPNLGKRVARFGVVKKVTNFSEHVEDENVNTMIVEAKSNAKVHEEDLLYFLENNKETYPEFFTACDVGQIKASIRISKA
jgi:hypothetical protein